VHHSDSAALVGITSAVSANVGMASMPHSVRAIWRTPGRFARICSLA